MAKTKAQISCAVTAQLICVFVFAYANCWFSHAQAQLVGALGRVSTDNVSLMKFLCHRNFGNEFVFTHRKDFFYYLARLPLSQIFDNETLPQN